MNKTLLLARHGKAEKSDFETLDFKRKLTDRGKEDVLKVSTRLAQELSIDKIVSSPAERAYKTAKIFAKTFNIQKEEIELIESIYESSMQNLLYTINHLDNNYHTILLVGHNPAFEYAIEYFSGEHIAELPTSGTAIISFPFNNWELISQGTGKLKSILIP